MLASRLTRKPLDRLQPRQVLPQLAALLPLRSVQRVQLPLRVAGRQPFLRDSEKVPQLALSKVAELDPLFCARAGQATLEDLPVGGEEGGGRRRGREGGNGGGEGERCWVRRHRDGVRECGVWWRGRREG